MPGGGWEAFHDARLVIWAGGDNSECFQDLWLQWIKLRGSTKESCP